MAVLCANATVAALPQLQAFSSWVLYGEPTSPASGGAPQGLGVTTAVAAEGTCPALDLQSALGPVPGAPGVADGGISSAAVPQAISPVFTMWLTLVMMFAANCLADYLGLAAVQAALDAQLLSGAAGGRMLTAGLYLACIRHVVFAAALPALPALLSGPLRVAPLRWRPLLQWRCGVRGLRPGTRCGAGAPTTHTSCGPGVQGRFRQYACLRTPACSVPCVPAAARLPPLEAAALVTIFVGERVQQGHAPIARASYYAAALPCHAKL